MSSYLNYFVITLVFLAIAGIAESAVTQPGISDNRRLHLGTVKPDRTQVPRYGKVEFSLDLQATYPNAFDPEDIDVSGSFHTPGGKTVTVPGFYYEDYTRSLKDGKEELTPKGEPGWRIRFSPTQTGRYLLTVSVRDRTGKTEESQPVDFTCVASRNPGFVRISSVDKRYFAFDNGSPYVPIGANVCWGNGPGTFSYDRWLPHYGKAGCSYFRAWLDPGWVTFALERKGEPRDRYGVGKLDLANAWRLDYVMDLAARQGLYVQLCIDSFNELRKTEEGSYPYWDETPHNAANGGPLKEPKEFWTNPEMLRLYRNKLRYLVARYGWDPHVLSWEFWNEVDIISRTAYVPDEVTRWHKEMSDYLRAIDPWKHLQTTSFAYSGGKPEIDGLSQMDYIQTHNYGSRDTAEVLSDWQKRKEKLGKPHYVGEFGSDVQGNDSKADPDGTALHNGIWSTLMSGSAGSGMLWWWDNYIDPRNLYYHLAALTGFVKGIDFPHEHFEPIDKAVFSFTGSSKRSTYTNLLLSGPVEWKPSPANRPITISVNGSPAPQEPVSGILHGLVNHRDLHNPLTLHIDLPHATRLHIFVTGVSGYGGARLTAALDGEPALDKNMPDDPGNTKHETLRRYDDDYRVDIPTGEHKVVVENTGKDWLLVHYELERAVRLTAPNLRAFGMKGKTTSLLWIQNKEHAWSRANDPKALVEQPESILRIPDWPAGDYQVVLWDTYKGKEVGTHKVTVGESGLELRLPAIPKDVAVRMKRLP